MFIPPYRLDPTVATVVVLIATALVLLRRDNYAQGFVEGVTRKSGHKLHSVPPIRSLRA